MLHWQAYDQTHLKNSYISFQKLTKNQTNKIFKIPDLEVLDYEWHTTQTQKYKYAKWELCIENLPVKF